FETVLVEGGEPQLLELHQGRWQQGAALLGMPPPPDLDSVQALAAEAVARSGIDTGALRLNWSRGSGGRGLELPPAGQPGRCWLQLTACAPLFTPVAVIVSPSERRCASSLLSRVKSFAYGASIQARLQARVAGADDALLESTAGGLCCGTVANLLVRIDGIWWTPPLRSGCLPGVMRRRALELGLVAEAETPMEAAWLRDGTAQAALLLNSLGCRPVLSCDGRRLEAPDPASAEALWRALL
ncbi:MAG: aminotransferase class IV, partial [Cyanobium sp.]